MPYTVTIRAHITVLKNGIVYRAVYCENTAVDGPLLMMVRSVFLRHIYDPDAARRQTVSIDLGKG